MSTVKPTPDSSSVVRPVLVCRDVAAAIDFCKTALGAVELGRRPGPDGTVAHALMTIGPAMFMIEAEWPTLSSRAPHRPSSRERVFREEPIHYQILKLRPLPERIESDILGNPQTVGKPGRDGL